MATAVWPASGIALAAVLLLGTRVWPGVWLGALLANGMNALVALAVSGSVGEPGAWLGDLLDKMPHVSLATAAAIATGNTCEALLAAWLCRRWLPQEQPRSNAWKRFSGLRSWPGWLRWWPRRWAR